MSDFTWATVTAVGPLRIRLDGDASQLPITPDSLMDPLTLAIADRVRVEIATNRVIVHGRSSGGVDPSPIGSVFWTVSKSAAANFLVVNGSAVSRTTYPALFAMCNPVVGSPTMAIGSPGLLTLAAHGLATGAMVYLTTTGALLTGLAVDTAYFAVVVSSSTFRLATTLANALAGTAINLSGTQSGVHTLRTSFGVGNGTTTFNLPNLTGRAPFGVDTGQTEFAAMGIAGGSKQLMPHQHTVRMRPDGSVVAFNIQLAAAGNTFAFHSAGTQGGQTSAGADGLTGATGAGNAGNALPPYLVLTPVVRAL